MTRAPTFDDIFAVMSAASVGETAARVPMPNDPPLDDIATKMAIALNLLLDDLAFRSAERERMLEALRENEINAHSLLRLSRRLERAQTYSEVLGAALDEVKVVLGYQSVWTYLLSEDKQQLRPLTTTGGKS